MKIKFYHIVMTLSLVVLLFTSCNDDLDTFPTDQISDQTVTESVSNMMIALNGIHRFMYRRLDSQGQGGYGGIMLINEAMGEDYVFTGNSNRWYRSEYRWISHRNATSSVNRYPYKFFSIINVNANVLINETQDTPGDPDLKRHIIGQAKVYRAFAHFNMVQLYASRYIPGAFNSQPGIPIVESFSTSGYPRATVEEVYDFINAELDEAIEMLDGYNRANNSHINKSVALGLKARVLLTQGRWNEAASTAIEARSGFSLMSNDEYKSGFNDYSNEEWMWGCTIVDDQTAFFANFGAYISRNFNSTNIRTNPKAVNVLMYQPFPDSDVRKQLIDPTGEHVDLNLPSNFNRRPHTSQKFLAVNTSDSRMDVPYMRAAEMYLIEAEAKARSTSFSDNDAAQALLPLAQNRDMNYVLSSNTGNDLVEEIMNQRRLELWGEGFRFLDLKRLNLPLDRTGANHSASVSSNVFEKAAGTNEWTWLIPQDELNSNPLIGEQNP